MCTAVVGFDPSSPVPLLLAGVRDEFADRPWAPPGAHWPDRPALLGGRDLRAGGTWLAVDPDAPRVACVLNGRGRLAPEEGRASRGELPLRAAADGGLGDLDLARFDPFHLVCAGLGGALLWSWDGHELAERKLGPGLHMIVNTGLEGGPATSVDPWERESEVQMTERIAFFRPRLTAARRPEPRTGTTAGAWGEWLPLLDGGGLDRADRRALVLTRRYEAGLWGTSSVSLVALSPQGVRYDFTAAPGDPRAWTAVLPAAERGDK
ncbi:Transport and Golgi organisation 2 [Thermomonospora echinospora]|uniref:Transport and Golgi organisation 2 n=1 Tax=Thermomonospora echinospora TaxID=1992 RepID=A0A1H6C0C8_9ACTN|nr:NRDE family protein [Thermomonospora echinospora]SEG66429.1 Transport and Golgi organisation 2 [Thermomonospora echinospora]